MDNGTKETVEAIAQENAEALAQESEETTAPTGGGSTMAEIEAMCFLMLMIQCCTLPGMKEEVKWYEEMLVNTMATYERHEKEMKRMEAVCLMAGGQKYIDIFARFKIDREESVEYNGTRLLIATLKRKLLKLYWGIHALGNPNELEEIGKDMDEDDMNEGGSGMAV